MRVNKNLTVNTMVRFIEALGFPPSIPTLSGAAIPVWRVLNVVNAIMQSPEHFSGPAGCWDYRSAERRRRIQVPRLS